MFIIWSLFILLIIFLLALDLGVFHKKDEAISMKGSLVWTGIWIIVSLLFTIPLYFIYRADVENIDINNVSASTAVIEYITGYVIEKSLSLDNIFVIAMIFSFFRIPLKYQHRILFWGILGAILFRGIMILFGTTLIRNFHWVNYVFGVLLLYSARKMLKLDTEETDFRNSTGIKVLSRFFPISWEIHGGKFFTRKDGKKVATLLFASLVVIEFSDVLFAVDSIPAIFAVTTDPFIVFTSNIFAILGLRSLYFFLANMLDRFVHLKYSLIIILTYVAIKMLIVDFYEISPIFSLIVILTTLAIGVIYSVFHEKKQIKEEKKNPE